MSIKISGAVVIDDDKNITASNASFSGTGSLKLPSGTTAQRPAGPSNGELRYNSTLDRVELYKSSVGDWGSVGGTSAGRIYFAAG